MFRKSTLAPAALALAALTLACASAEAQPRSTGTQKPRAEESTAVTPKVEAPGGALNKVASPPIIGAANVTKNQCGVITITVVFNDDWKPMPGFNGSATYRVERYAADNTLSEVASSNDPVINIAWPVGDGFKFIVWARSRETATLGVTKVRKVGEVQGIVSNYCPPPPPPYVPEPGELLLKHQLSRDCMFGDANNGGGVQAAMCVPGPHMSYVLDSAGGNQFRLRHRSTNKCVYVDANNDNIARNWDCWDDPNMRFVKEPVPGGDRFRLRHVATGKCLFVLPAGRLGSNRHAVSPVRGLAACTDSPFLVWVAEPF